MGFFRHSFGVSHQFHCIFYSYSNNYWRTTFDGYSYHISVTLTLLEYIWAIVTTHFSAVGSQRKTQALEFDVNLG